ncbi:MAG: Phosphoglycerol transferase I [Phycisphaerae bacterium]|nr:Phosphoglycerol transferase I [Phycisphaerae bacterium]
MKVRRGLRSVNSTISILRWLRPVLVFYAAGIVIFSLDRVVFLLCNYYSHSIGEVVPRDVLRCFRVGWFYDNAVLCYALIPTVVAWTLFPRRWFTHARFRLGVSAAAAVAFTLMLFGCISDLYFFDHYWDRLNYQAFCYPVWRPEVMDMIWKGWPIGWSAALLVLVGIICYGLFGRVGWPSVAPRGRMVGRPMVAGCLSLLAVLGVQGPPNPTDSDTSPSQFSKQWVINRASLNPVFNLGSQVMAEITEQTITPERYRFLPDQGEAYAVARQLYDQPGDQWAPPGAPNPMLRVSQPGTPLAAGQRPPNVVLIVMESMSSDFVASLGGGHDWTPELEAVGRRGIMLDRFYSVGTRTSRGLVGSISGLPDMPGRPIAENRHSRGAFLTLAGLLRDRGYATEFIHGGNLWFNNIKGYLQTHGFETIVDKESFAEEIHSLKDFQLAEPGVARFSLLWCVDDQSLFIRANRMLREAGKSDRPFFAVILTLTNHPPFEVPPEVFDWTVRRSHPDLPAEMSDEERAVRYADWAVGDFFRRAEKEDYFNNTIFVLTADHCRAQRRGPVDAANFHIYGSIVGPERLIGPPRRIATVCSQADLAVTVLSRLGRPFEHCFFGRDILRTPQGEGFAIVQQNGVIGFVQKDRLLCTTPGDPGPAIDAFHLRGREQIRWDPADAADAGRIEQSRRTGMALFQSAVDLFQRDLFHVGEE